MTIHLPPDIERLIQAAVHSGHFASVDDAMTEAASLLLQRLKQEQAQAMPEKTAANEEPTALPRKPIWERILERSAAIPDEEWEKLPVNGAEQHDHYIYGTPKRRMKDLVETIGDLAESLSDLARRAAEEYAPVVDSIVRAQSQDIRHIEHTLDGLLDFCFDPERCSSTRHSAAITSPSILPPPRSMSTPTARCGSLNRRCRNEHATLRSEKGSTRCLRSTGGTIGVRTIGVSSVSNENRTDTNYHKRRKTAFTESNA